MPKIPDNWISVYVDEPRPWNKLKKTRYQINWSCVGAQPVEVAEAFAKKMLKVVRAVRTGKYHQPRRRHGA